MEIFFLCLREICLLVILIVVSAHGFVSCFFHQLHLSLSTKISTLSSIIYWLTMIILWDSCFLNLQIYYAFLCLYHHYSLNVRIFNIYFICPFSKLQHFQYSNFNPVGLQSRNFGKCFRFFSISCSSATWVRCYTLGLSICS